MNSEILKKALSLINTPETWCQGARARNADGWEIPVMSDTAKAFCAKGALMRAVGAEDEDAIAPAARYLEKIARVNYVGFNELHTYDEVLEMFENAIELAEVDDAKFGGPPTYLQHLLDEIDGVNAGVHV